VRLTSPRAGRRRTRYLADGGRRSRHPEAALPRHIDPDDSASGRTWSAPPWA